MIATRSHPSPVRERIVPLLRSHPIPLATLVAMSAGAAARYLGTDRETTNIVWTVGLVICGGQVVWRTLVGMIRGRFAADIVAALAVIVALVLGQPLVGLVIVLMQSGGELLEGIAEGRATDALRALQDAAPRTIHRVSNGSVEDVDADIAVAGDTILVRPGEVIPCDGEVVSGISHVDTSRITGEPVPIVAAIGVKVMSGTVNQQSPLTIRITAPASQSQYARIVQLVRKAQRSKAPLQRVADRYAIWFTPLTIAVCAIAYAVSGDSNRVLAVLAVATPCPLILAVPVAVLGGMNRAARRQVLMRSGGALEALGGITAVIFDKTGTMTIGRPRVARLLATDGIDESRLLELAAGVEHYSGHLLARTLVEEAESRGIEHLPAEAVSETPGRGVEGNVDGHHVIVGSRSLLVERFPGMLGQIAAVEAREGSGAALRAYVAIDGGFAGLVEYADVIRPGMREMIERLAELGVSHTMLLSGDRDENVQAVASSVGIEIARGDLLPEDKVTAVDKLMSGGESVLMVGDGTNDAPALMAATVGVALASQGRGIATESAGAILLADDPSRLVDAIQISRRTMRIARQSIVVGLGLSGVGMLAAATGMITPLAGALVQEGIDLAVILNALRASARG